MHEIAFGNGGTNVDPTGVITYLPANSTGQNASLYNQTYYKVIDDNSSLNTDASRNKISVNHVSGNIYSDVVISCLLLDNPKLELIVKFILSKSFAQKCNESSSALAFVTS